MPLGYIRAMLVKAEHEYLEARRLVRAGHQRDADEEREWRDMWWQAYRLAKANQA